MVPLLAKLAADPQLQVPALKALVFLSSISTNENDQEENNDEEDQQVLASTACLFQLQQQASGIGRMLELVLQPPPPPTHQNNNNSHTLWKQTTNYAMALLANMTRTEAGALELVGKTLPDEPVLQPQQQLQTVQEEEDNDEKKEQDVLKEKERAARKRHLKMDLLLARFLNISFTASHEDEDKKDGTVDDPYQHFAWVLMNATQTPAGRNYLFLQQRGSTTRLQQLLPQLRSSSCLRRRGIAGAVRNCCSSAQGRESAWWLLNKVQILPHLLYPLAGPEELDVEEKQGLDPDVWLQGPDKVREPDATTRLYLVEALLVLCTTGRKSRETMRLARVYVVLKVADMVEENDQVSEQIYECVNFLRRDEEGTHEGSSDQMVADAYTKRQQQEVKPSRIVQLTEDFDGLD